MTSWHCGKTDQYIIDKFISSDNCLKLMIIEDLCSSNSRHDLFKNLFELDNVSLNSNNIPFIRAISSNNIIIFNYLLEKGGNISNGEIKKIIIDMNYCIKIDTLKFFIEYGVDFVSDTELIEKYIGYNDDKVKLLIENGVNPNASTSNGYLLEIAAKKSIYSTCKLLILHGADPSLNNSLCLSFAIQHAREDIIKLFLQYGANTSFVTAADFILMLKKSPSIDLINFLINYGFDLSIINTYKFVRNNQVFEKLLEVGVDPIQLINCI